MDNDFTWIKKEEDSNRDLRVVRTEYAIKKAFAEEITCTEYQRITVSEIARKAQINRKTFYAHYSCIDDLVKSMLAEYIDYVCRNAIDKATQKGEDYGLDTLTPALLTALDESFDERDSLVRSLGELQVADMIIEPLQIVIEREREKRGMKIDAALKSYIACYAGSLIALYIEWRGSAMDSCSLEELSARANKALSGLAELLF